MTRRLYAMNRKATGLLIRMLLISAVFVLTFSVLLPLSSQVARADPASITLDPSSGTSGDLDCVILPTVVTISGSGFPPWELVTITFDSEHLTFVTSDLWGNFFASAHVPDQAPCGVYTITASALRWFGRSNS